MSEPHERLAEARKSVGYSKAVDACRAFSWNENTYRSLENGNRTITPEWAVRCARAFKVDPSWILYGIEGKNAELLPRDINIEARGAAPGSAVIQELDVTASAGSGALDGAINQDAVIADWVLPSDYIRGRTDAPAPALKIIRVEGDSMSPDFPPGSRVMVNINDKIPSPPGVFVVWDGMGLVMKRVEPIYGSDPQRVRLSSINAAYTSYEALLDEAHINGRVIGKWQWT